MIAALTGMGLSAAAGLNAYIPFIIVALLARFTDAVVLPTGFEWMESWWAIGIGAVLLVTEITLDKVPAVDSLNDAVQTVIRPGMGGLMGAATAGASTLDESTWMQEHAWVGVVLGIVVAGLVHTGKAASRPVINAGTAGFGAPVASTAEDGAAVASPSSRSSCPCSSSSCSSSSWRRWSGCSARGAGCAGDDKPASPPDPPDPAQPDAGR